MYMKVSVIIPAYNEEKAIEEVVNDVKSAVNKDYEIIVVDDGSSDNTYEKARKISGIRAIRHRKNMGKAGALRTGFEAAKGHVMATIDADCTYPAKDMQKIVAPVINGDADVVIGSRFMGKETEMARLNYFGNSIFAMFVTVLTGKSVTDPSSGMRAFGKDVWKSLDIKAKGLDWEVEMTTASLRRGYRLLEIPIAYHDRVGEAKLSRFDDGARFLRAILRARFRQQR